ncbi:MAG: hypothetical protein GEV08_17770, partial [Acidimicrobiia bacterium]|nr:hypothetical protein [Acidimicrobiia bacterium]
MTSTDETATPGPNQSGRVPRLRARAVRLDASVDPLAVAGPHGAVWLSPTATLAGRGEAARISV